MRWQKSYNDQNHTSWEEKEYWIINEINITFLHLFLLYKFLHFCISFYLSLNRCRILILCCHGHFAPRQGNPRTMDATLRGLRNEMAPQTENCRRNQFESYDFNICLSIYIYHILISYISYIDIIYIHISYVYHIYHTPHKMISFCSAKGDWKKEETDTKRKRKWENERLHKKRKHPWLASA